jgi:SAM domain (Sterile alpha motif)
VDVAAWLKNLGLGQYEASFHDNAIGGDLLPTLTAEDLKDLGVTIVGHRRKLLDAIAALGAASKPMPGSAAADPSATLPAPTVSSRTAGCRLNLDEQGRLRWRTSRFRSVPRGRGARDAGREPRGLPSGEIPVSRARARETWVGYAMRVAARLAAWS